jgi:AAA family ATP:ADP antiporter
MTIAGVCAFAMIATQVAGKTARDALFLTNFPVSALPLVLIASAVLSIVAALLTARAMTLYGPARIVPPLFLASGLLLLVEWWLAARSPRPAAVVVYLHVASLGSILISGFWSLIDEAFDPRTAKVGIGRIIGGATAGGLFGGLLAERVGALAGVLWIIPIIAALHLGCALLLPRFSHDETHRRAFSLGDLFSLREREHTGESGFQVLRRSSYLRSLAAMVLLGNVAATLLDYLFKARATEGYPQAGELVRFFAVFYTVVSLLTLAVQTGMTRRLIEGIGIANTLAIRPGLVTLGGVATLPAMGLLGVGVLRGLEMVAQSSLFRSGYELLFTPVVPDEKRRIKTIVDVGADRMGDIVGAALIRAVIMLPAAAVSYVLVSAAVAISLVSLVVARALHRGYVRALEASLLHRANALDISSDPSATRTLAMESFTGIDFSMTGAGIPISELRALAGLREGATTQTGSVVEHATTATLTPVVDPELASLIELRSGDPKRVHAELNRSRVLAPMIAAQVITLLAWDEVSGWASRSLAKAAPFITGQLVDRLLDSDEDFAIRRRIPRILSTCPTQRSVGGLLAALSDERFEVRYQAARAMTRIHESSPNVPWTAVRCTRPFCARPASITDCGTNSD